MTREHAGWLVWGIWFFIFVAFEIPAVAEAVPWPSLSATVWNLEQRWEWTSIPLIGGLSILAVHLIRTRSVQQGDQPKGGGGRAGDGHRDHER